MPARVLVLLASAFLLLAPLAAATPADAGTLLAAVAVMAIGVRLVLNAPVGATTRAPVTGRPAAAAMPRIRVSDPDDAARPRPRAPGGTPPAR